MKPVPPSGRRRPPSGLAVLLVLMVIPSSTAIPLVLGALALSVAGRMLRGSLAARRIAAASEVADGVLLGQDRGGAPVVVRDRQLAAHGLILGASGAGKSTTLLAILSDHIARGRPVVAIDMKGSPAFQRSLATAAAAAGRPLRVWTPDGPERWNPLAHGNATELKDKLISTERFTEPHYRRAAERYLQLALQVLLELHPNQPATLAEVVDTMEPRRLALLAREVPPQRAERLQQYLASLTPDQQSAIHGMGARLAILSESHTGPYLEAGAGSGVDLRRALAGEEVVLFSLNSSLYGQLSAQLGTLAIQDLVAATGHRLTEVGDGLPDQQALIGIDEFSALGADNVISLLARGRESGVSVLLATQELADLDRAARGLRDQVLGVTAVKIVHRQDVPASAQTVAQMAGTEKVWEQTYRFGQSSWHGRDTSRGTEREVEQFRVHPNEIKTLGTGEALVITKVPTPEVRIAQVAAPRQAVAQAPQQRPAQVPQQRPAQTPQQRTVRVPQARSANAPQQRTAQRPRQQRSSRSPERGPELG